MKLEFSGQFFSKNTQILIFKKILSVEAALFHADRRTDVTKLTVAFRHFANGPKNSTANVNIKCPTYLHFNDH